MPRSDQPFDPDTFDFGPPRQLGPLAGVQGDSLFGYYQLERSERFATEQARWLRPAYVDAWYRLLDGYYRSLDVGHVVGEDLQWATVWKILRLGICAAKGALDATLAGYYVGAFGDIRQMAEYWFGIEYLKLHPESVAGFYKAEEGEEQVRLPRMGRRIRSVLAAFAPSGVAASAENERFAHVVDKTYKRMSDGHHLDGLAMVQTGDLNAPGYYLGAGYDPSLANEACDHGTLMTGILALTAAYHMSPLNPRSGTLIPQISAAMHDAIAVQPLREEAGEQPPSE
jgi:hypothetical protein